MSRRKKAMKGFTIIEVMIALFIITVMTSITIVTFSSLYKANETKHFLQLLKRDIYLTQQTAISTGVRTYFYVDNQNSVYAIRQRGENLFVQPYDERISIEKGTLTLNEIAFNRDGNIMKPGTIFIRTGKESYKVVFQLGRGRFYVEKL